MKNLINQKRLFLLLAVMLTYSCSNQDFYENFDYANQSCPLTRAYETIPTTDSIIPYNQPRIEPIQPIDPIMPLTNTLYDDIYSLRELPINIIVRGNARGGHFLTTQGAGQAIYFAEYKNSKNQQFYIKILPPSSGIRYVIYSQQTDTPIAIGHYVSDPDKQALFPMTSNSFAWGTSWDFLQGSTDGAVAIQNMQIKGGGPDYQDMYPLVIGASQSDVTFLRYNKSATQEFDLQPVEKFVIQSLEFVNDATATFTHKPSKVLHDGYSNNGPLAQNYTLQISEEVSETSSFTDKTSVSLQISTSFQIKVPFIVDEKISTTTTTSSEHTYGESSTIKRAISRTYPVSIPAMSRADLSITLFDDEIDMNYTATCKGVESGRIITLHGVWHGVNVSQSESTLTITPLDSRLAVKTYVFDEENNKWVLQL